ncbi:MAG TPA: PLP-dependent aspartate aminotransferase family protein [Chthonomonadales bacterium]|nr:PLP-dependent aspartate aminotransferase family protein [Chthonomonadales bacterium]
MREPGFGTRCVHHGDDYGRHFGSPSPPIYQTATFVATDAAQLGRRERSRPPGYDYTRVDNPTTHAFESHVAALEGAEAARSFASGMGAIAAVVLHACGAGDHVVCVDTVYGPTQAFLRDYASRFGVEATFVDGRDPAEFAEATRPNTRLFFLESPSTRVFHLQDLAAVAAIARELSILTALDNSWASPCFQNPHEYGIDLVVHSATKYIGGHSDVLAGVVTGNARRIRRLQLHEGVLLGGVLDPFAAWLLLRGLRTLALRMERHQASGLTVARALERHPRVHRVLHPGLPSHPQHALAARQMRGYGGLFSVVLAGADRDAARAAANALRYFGVAFSWGGYESLCVPVEFPEYGGQWGLRLHVGLEDPEDLLDDLLAALGA